MPDSDTIPTAQPFRLKNLTGCLATLVVVAIVGWSVFFWIKAFVTAGPGSEAAANDVEYITVGPFGDASALNWAANRLVARGRGDTGSWTAASHVVASTMFGAPGGDLLCSVRYRFSGNLSPLRHAHLLVPLDGAQVQVAAHLPVDPGSSCFAAPRAYRDWVQANGDGIELVVALKDGTLFEYVPSAGGWASMGPPDEHTDGRLAHTSQNQTADGSTILFGYEVRW